MAITQVGNVAAHRPHRIEDFLIRSTRSGVIVADGRAAADTLTAGKSMSVILVLNQYKCIGCSPGKHSDTRRMAAASGTGSRDIVHDRYLCIAV
jgi:hypothetical protein